MNSLVTAIPPTLVPGETGRMVIGIIAGVPQHKRAAE